MLERKHFRSMQAVFLLIALQFLLATRADAQCTPIVTVPGTAFATFDPFEPVPDFAELSMSFDNRGSDGCNLRIKITSDVGTIPPFLVGPDNLELRLAAVSEGNELQQVSPGVFLANLPADAITERSFEFRPTSRASPRAGSADTVLNVEITDAGTGTTLLPAEPVLLTIGVVSRAQVNIAGAQASFNASGGVSRLDFGELQSGERQRVFVQLRSTSQAILSVSSINGGALASGETFQRVPYQAVLDGRQLDLSSSTSIDVDPTPELAGVSLPLDIVIGDTSRATAGHYEDVISIEIAPL